MDNLNVLHQMNEFKKVLSYCKNIGFFFGAGTSCAFGLPDIHALTSEIFDRLDLPNKEIFNNAKHSIKELTGKSSVTVEDILNFIRQIRSITYERADCEYRDITGEQAKNIDKEICHNIFYIITQKENVADITEIKKFFAWYDSINHDFIKEIFTTNYDMLLEMAMEADYIPYFDGFTGSYEPFFNPESIDAFPLVADSTGKWIRLWKIHGSLNWELMPSTSSRSNRIVRTGNLTDPKNELMIYPSKEKYDLSRKQPFIAYFDRLKKYLLRGELLFVFSGYSFFDQHINEIIFDCLRQNNRLYAVVFCYTDSQLEIMKQYALSYLNLCVMGPTKVISKGKIYNWVFDDSREEKDGCEFYWNGTNHEFLLGDFKKLINFFIDNSGKRSIIEEAIHEK